MGRKKNPDDIFTSIPTSCHWADWSILFGFFVSVFLFVTFIIGFEHSFGH